MSSVLSVVSLRKVFISKFIISIVLVSTADHYVMVALWSLFRLKIFNYLKNDYFVDTFIKTFHSMATHDL